MFEVVVDVVVEGTEVGAAPSVNVLIHCGPNFITVPDIIMVLRGSAQSDKIIEVFCVFLFGIVDFGFFWCVCVSVFVIVR